MCSGLVSSSLNRPGPGADMGRTSSSFERVSRPDPSRALRRDGLGKEALYSTAPTASPPSPLVVECRRCGVAFGSSVVGVARLFARPFLADPLRRRVWTRCPVCSRRAWLELHAGPALRTLLDRTPGG